MTSALHPISASFYSDKLKLKIDDLAVPAWSANELWGKKTEVNHFRNCLVGTIDQCSGNLSDWYANGIVVKESSPAYFILHQKFEFRGASYERWAVFGSIDLSEGVIKTHEEVYVQGVKLAAKRSKACESDLTPIFVGIEEKYQQECHKLAKGLVKGKNCILTYQESPNSIHTLWKVQESEEQLLLSNFFANKSYYLLDGHHRLKAAQINCKDGEGDGKIFACVTSMGSNDLLILPIHRLILQENWILPEAGLEALEAVGCKRVGETCWQPELLEEKQLPNLGANSFFFLPVQSTLLYHYELPDSQTDLAVERLERDVLGKIPELQTLPVVEVSMLIDELAAGQAHAAIFLAPPTPKEVCSVADSGDKLPKKSTRFFPKPALGLLFRQWEESDL